MKYLLILSFILNTILLFVSYAQGNTNAMIVNSVGVIIAFIALATISDKD